MCHHCGTSSENPRFWCFIQKWTLLQDVSHETSFLYLNEDLISILFVLWNNII